MLPQQFEKITERGVRGMILAALETGSAGWVNDVAMRMTSDQASEEYGWIGTPPAMREFVAGRSAKELREFSFIVANEDYESTLRIKSKDMRRDKFGMINIRVNQLAERVLDHPGKLLSTLIENGESTVCYDGQYFFDTDHSEGSSGTQDNDLTYAAATGTTPTVSEMSDAILKMIQQMYGFKDDQGEPINQGANMFQVHVPILYMATALQAVTSMLVGNGNTNVLPALQDKFKVEVVPNPRLTWTTKIAAFRTDSAAKPFILQEEDIPDVVVLGEGSEFEKLNKEQLYGVDWTGNVAYGYWQHACLTTFT